jgi:phage terminase large subunit-like protein
VTENNRRPEIAPEFYVRGSMAGCWITERTMSWQRGKLANAYYADEESRLLPEEFLRIHKNQWGSSTDVFVPSAWWDDCAGTIPEDAESDLWVLGLDAAVSDDCFAAIAVSKRLTDGAWHYYVRYSRIWYPPEHGRINFDDVQSELDTVLDSRKIACIAYDETQMAQMAEHFAHSYWTEKFDQGKARLVADKGLYDRIKKREITHTGDPELNAHVKNANRKVDGQERTLRIVKRNDQDKIDACVALSMAVAQAAKLNI